LLAGSKCGKDLFYGTVFMSFAASNLAQAIKLLTPFESRQVHRLTWLGYFVVYLNLCRSKYIGPRSIILRGKSVNRSQTEVKSFLFVSLGSSTVLLHDNLVAKAHAHVQRLVLVDKMVTVLEVFTTEDQRSVVLRDSMQRIFIKKCFLFTVGSVCRVKRFTTGRQTFL
jgi:hypothetical protein